MVATVDMEITDAMIGAGIGAYIRADANGLSGETMIIDVFKAMRAAQKEQPPPKPTPPPLREMPEPWFPRRGE